MRLRILVYTILAIACSISCLAQEGEQKATLKFVVNPGHSYRVKIDGELQKAHNIFEVSAGKHTVSLWAPDYLAFDTTFTIGAGEDVRIVKVLKHTPEFNNYRALLSDYRGTQFQLKFIPSAILVGTVTTGILSYTAMNRHHRNMIDLRFDQQFAPPEQESAIRVRADDAERNFKTNRAALLTSTGLTIATGVFSYFSFKKANSMPIPQRPKINPWKLEGYGFYMNENGGVSVGLTWKF